MNATSALAAAFLKGEIITVKTAFKDFGITNIAREAGRSIERKFGVKLSRVHRTGKSRYGVPCNWMEYRLSSAPFNKEGREKMLEYIKKHSPVYPRTNREKELAQQLQLTIK